MPTTLTWYDAEETKPIVGERMLLQLEPISGRPSWVPGGWDGREWFDDDLWEMRDRKVLRYAEVVFPKEAPDADD